MAPVPLAKRASYSLSTLAETADEYIRLECARRRNQTGIRRRASIVEQYSVRAPSSRLKERRAQSRHHAFLMRKDNKAAIDRITDSVRELAELHSSAQGGSGANQLSPMEKDKLLAWTQSVDSLLTDFVPSENHSLDPVACMLEKLQFLQDGHVCLAEVAVDARALLEQWDRGGIFDASESSDDDGLTIAESEEAGETNSAELEDTDNYGAAWQRGKSSMAYSHAYETVRQRAAANLIKRCVVRWVRAQESFRDRVDEIQLFGKTTSSLMKELTSTTSMRRPTGGTSDNIFDLVKVKQSEMYANSISFSDLMQFSKHVGIFSVDHAIRRIEELEMKRYLFMTRCALKLQTIWRKARKEFQARRMQKLVEELCLQRVKQEKEERERLLLSGSSKDAPDTSEGKRKSVLSPSKKTRAVSVSTPLSSDSSRASSRPSEQPGSHTSTPQHNRLRASVVGVVKRKESTTKPKASAGDKLDSAQGEKRKRLNRGKSITSRSRFDDDDGDTTDVENAWQAFLDSATPADIDGEMEAAVDGSGSTPSDNATRDGGDVISRVVMPELSDNDWRSWSDDEEDDFAPHREDNADLEAEEKIARRLSLAASTALPPTPASETSGAALSGYDDTTLADSQQLSDIHRQSVLGNSVQSARGSMSQSPALPTLHGFHFDDNVDRFRAKKVRVGMVSRMIPFAEFDMSDSSAFESSATAVKKKPPAQMLQRLQELEFGMPESELALLQLADPLVRANDPETHELASDSVNASNSIHTARDRRKGPTRKRRVDTIRHAIAARDTEISTYHHTKDTQRQLKRYSTDEGADSQSTSPSKRPSTLDAKDAGAAKIFVYPMQSTLLDCSCSPVWTVR